MSKLYFKVGSDWEEVVRLRNEIAKLKQELKGMDGTQSPAAFKTLNTQLAASTQRMNELVNEAAKAGVAMEGDFKKKIFDASQSVNSFTEKIIAQKNAIGSLQTTIRKNKELYKNIVSRGNEDKELLNHIREQERALGKERDALFGLTQEQANARLSVKKLRDEYALYKNDGKQVVEVNNGIAISWKKALAVIGGAGVLKALGSEIIRVRGEFQSMQTTIETMVGKDVAGKLMPQIKELAKISPLAMTDMVGAEKMMLGFNIQAEDTIKYLKALSDISMGESGKFNSLTLAFSQMSATGKLMGQDLNQMINAGFNPLQTISEKTGKSIATLKDEMSKGAISAEMVQQAFIDATSAGGKFYNMSENASQTINGQMSMMQDAWDSVFNELGTKSEGVIMDGIQMTTSLIENYETVGKVLTGLVVTYGTYRTAVMLVAAAESKHTLVEIGLTNVRILARKAQLALNAAMLTNPYVALATVVIGLTTAMWAMSDSTTEAEKAQERFNKRQKEATKQEQEHKQKIDSLVQSSRNIALSDLQRGQSLAELRKEYPKIFAQYDIETIKLADILELKQQIAEEDAKRAGERVARDFEAANKAVSDYENTLTAKQINGGKLTQQEINKLKELRFDRDQFLVDRGSSISEQFISNLKNIDISEFDNYISKLENQIRGKGENGMIKIRLPIDEKGSLSDKAIYEVKEIKNLIDTTKSTKQARIDSEKNKTTYQEDLAKAKEDWEKAKKGYEALLKDQKATSEQVKEARDKMQTKEKSYKDLGGVTDTSKQENQAEKLRKEQEMLRSQNEKVLQLESKQSLERQRQQQDLENQAAQAKINAMTDGYEKEKAQRDLNNKIEIQNVKRQKEDYIRAEIQAQKEIFDAKEDLKSKQSKGYVKKIFDASTVNVDEIIAAWDKIVAHTETKQGLDEWQEREDAMNKYLMEYGTFSQKKAAIDKKFQDDINKETSLGAKNALQKQWNEAISSLKVDELKQEINWEMVFGDLSNASKESLDKIKKQLKEFRESQEYQSMDIDQKKIIDESLNKIQTTLIDKGGLLGGLPEQLNALRIAQEELIKAQEEYNDALKNGTESEQEAALIKKNNAEKGVQNAQTNVSQSAEKATSNVATLANVITDLGSNSQMSLSQVGQLAGTLADTFSESGKKIGGIIGAVFSALDSIGEQGLDGFLGNIFDSIFNAAYGAWDTVFGWTGLDFGGESDPQLQKDIENLTQSNQDLEMAIDNLADKMESTSVVESTEVYNQQKSNLEQQMRNTQEMMRRSAEAYSNGFLGMGGSHSSNKKINNAMSSSDWARISGVVGHTVNNASDFWNLTSEQMAKVALEATDLYTKIKNSADDGYRDAAQYMDSYISYYKELEELQNAYYEKLTSTSFDSVKDNFRTSLLEMKDNAEAFAEDFEEMMQNALLEIMMTGVYDKKLQEWYTNFAKSVESDKKLTPEEMEASKQDYLDIVEEAKAEWENYQKMFGWSDSTSDSAKEALESFVSDMQSALTSLDVTAKDVSDNIYDYFRQAMINALYEKEYKSKMEELYKTFEGLSADGLSESDMAQLGSQVDQYIEQMMKGVESVNSIFADKLKDAEDLQSFVDNVKSAMSSIEATAEDVTDNIFEYIRQQMVDKMFADTFQPQIEEFYKKVQEAMFDGDITDAERNALRSEAEKLANDITTAKDILSDTLGITESSLKKELEEEFKSFSDGILNSLYNAEVTAESVAKDIAESMRKELIEAMYIEQYEPRIKAIWEKWKEYSADGLVTDEERANIKTDIDELSKEVSDAAKEISDAWTDSGEEVKKAFESFSDSIKNVLYDAEATAEDVANNIYQYMRNALVDSMFTAQLQPQIQAWYDKYTEFMKDGAIDTAERKTLDEMIAEIQKAGVDIVDAANALFPSLDTGAIKRAEEAAQEAENARNEAEQEWESFSDGILNSLYDIEATAEDISDDMSEYMRKALIKAMYVENFKPQMQKWYNEWQRAMGDDNLTSEEKQLLDSMKQTMVDDMKKEVDAINQFFGTMFSQQASSKGFEAMSQDTGEELNGRFTALQVAGEEIKNQAVQQTGLLSSIDKRLSLIDITNDDIPALMSGTPNFVDKTRGIITNSYQSQINVVFPTEDIKVLTEKVSSMERIVDEMRTFQVEGNIARRDIVENSAILAKNSPKILAGTDEIKRNLKNL
jgi:tape measure domain-containing protein